MLKEIGDGVLASFNSVSEAVYCAKEIQKSCGNEPDLKLRIGIHEGEVVFEDDDVFGDGVNIASRLERLAPIGGILVSEAVHKNVLNKKGITTILVGEKELRGVREPVKIYQVMWRMRKFLSLKRHLLLLPRIKLNMRARNHQTKGRSFGEL